MRPLEFSLGVLKDEYRSSFCHKRKPTLLLAICRSSGIFLLHCVTNVQERERCFWNTKKHADLHSSSVHGQEAEECLRTSQSTLQSGHSLYELVCSGSSRSISETSNVQQIKQSRKRHAIVHDLLKQSSGFPPQEYLQVADTHRSRWRFLKEGIQRPVLYSLMYLIVDLIYSRLSVQTSYKCVT
jgi:hypothetical protein